MRTRSKWFLWAAALLFADLAPAHNGSHPSVHDTLAGIIERLKADLSQDELVGLTVPRVQGLLTSEEREILGNEHLRFRVNVPVLVTILRDVSLENEPFWLHQRGFKRTNFKQVLHSREFDAWEKHFPAGEVGLGVPSLGGRGVHYLVLISPQAAEEELRVTDLYPGHLRLAPFEPGVAPFVDQSVELKEVPPQFRGRLIIRTDSSSVQLSKLVNLFSKTQYPAQDKPDHIILTWSRDPRTSQTIQWRSSTNITKGYIRYQPRSGSDDEKPANIKRARTERLVAPTLINDPIIARHTVTLRRLQAGTSYAYSVGDGSPEGWTEPAEFTTAPKEIEPFSFVYMGDAQNGLEQWGKLLEQAYRARPDAAFYLMAGDLVNRGAERWDWDSFFEHSEKVFRLRPIVPAIGNHECQGGAPKLYLEQFELPRNGPRGITPERAYVLDYSNARFIILDSNLDPSSQTAWLERQLASSKATWKFVSYHHPAYSASPNRDNKQLRDLWTPLFDKYHVDLALQGHDHSYLRTHPMRDEERVTSARDGTIYIVSVSGNKFYEQAEHSYTAAGLTKLSTYQVLDISIEGNRMVYRAHDSEGKVWDEFCIEK